MKIGKPRIVVLKMRELIKSGIIALAAIVLIVLLVYFLVPRKTPIEETRAAFIPGTYAGQIILHSKPVDVLVTVTENRITDIELSALPEPEKIFYPLFEPTMAELKKEIIRLQSLNIKSTAENAVTTKILLSAVSSALDKAGNTESTGTQVK